MIALAIDVTLRQGAFTLAIDERADVDVLGLFGSSGAGKTSLLECLAGLRTPDAGEIVVGGRVLLSTRTGVNLKPYERQLGYVPQDGALFPHLDVRRNLLYGARPAGGAHEASLTLEACAGMLEIAPLLDRPVAGLSGGERQRVAIGRALMSRPSLLLLDEPLAAVDRARRERILPYLLRIRRDLHVPMVYVTHDEAELAQVADRILFIEEGRVTRVGSSAHRSTNPPTPFN